MVTDCLKLVKYLFFSPSASTPTGYGKCNLCIIIIIIIIIIIHYVYTVTELINIISTAYITSSFVGLKSSHSLILLAFLNCVDNPKVSHKNIAMRMRSRIFGTDQPRREDKTDRYHAKDVDGCDSE